MSISIGDIITQQTTDENGATVLARGYVSSYDNETKVLKYIRDRSLYYEDGFSTKDYIGVSNDSKVVQFESTSNQISPISATIDTTFNGSTLTVNNKVIDLGVEFQEGIADPDINSKTGDILYLNNRPTISRNTRQKEDIKIILEF